MLPASASAGAASGDIDRAVRGGHGIPAAGGSGMGGALFPPLSAKHLLLALRKVRHRFWRFDRQLVVMSLSASSSSPHPGGILLAC